MNKVLSFYVVYLPPTFPAFAHFIFVIFGLGIFLRKEANETFSLHKEVLRAGLMKTCQFQDNKDFLDVFVGVFLTPIIVLSPAPHSIRGQILPTVLNK